MDDSQKIKLIELEKIRDDEQIADQKESIEVLTKDYDDMVLAKDTELDKKEQEKNKALTKKITEIQKKDAEIAKLKNPMEKTTVQHTVTALKYATPSAGFAGAATILLCDRLDLDNIEQQALTALLTISINAVLAVAVRLNKKNGWL